MATHIRRLSERHFEGVRMLFDPAVEEGALIEMLRANVEAGANGEAVALVAEDDNGLIVGFVNTVPHDDFDEGDDSHLDVDTLQIAFLLTASGQSDARPQLLGTLIPAITAREFDRIYRRVPESEHAFFDAPGWELLLPEHGIAWNDVDDFSSIFVQLPNVSERIAMHETGTGESSWAFAIPTDLDELRNSILAGREDARIARHD